MACGGRKAAAPPPEPAAERWQGSFSPPPAGGAEVIAEVNGEKIYAADVARQAAARGLDARAALAELIDAELLAQEARRRGLADDPEVAEARKRESVRRLMELAFEPSFDGPEDIPQETVDQVWGQHIVQSMYNHERYQRTAFVRIPLDKGKKIPPETEEGARRAAEAVYRAASADPPATVEDFFALGKKVAAELGHEATDGRFDTTRHNSSVEPYAAAAFSLDHHGQVAKPARTDWGWDVVYLDGVLPERHTSKGEAEPVIREQLLHPDRDHELGRLIVRFMAGGLTPPRDEAFLRWSDGLVAGAQVWRDDTLLDGIDANAPLVTP